MTVYLLHLNKPLGRGISPAGKPLQAGHYIGYADDLVGRILAHQETTWTPYEQPIVGEDGKTRCGERHGEGANFMGVANSRGCGWQLARTWDGAGRDFERRLKNRKEAPRLCPICNPGTEHRTAQQESKDE